MFPRTCHPFWRAISVDLPFSDAQYHACISPSNVVDDCTIEHFCMGFCKRA